MSTGMKGGWVQLCLTPGSQLPVFTVTGVILSSLALIHHTVCWKALGGATAAAMREVDEGGLVEQ